MVQLPDELFLLGTSPFLVPLLENRIAPIYILSKLWTRTGPLVQQDRGTEREVTEHQIIHHIHDNRMLTDKLRKIGILFFLFQAS